MLIPIGTDRPLHRPALITPLLIGINLALFIAQKLLERTDPERYEHLLRPLLISGPDFRPWQPLTYAFLHADWLHVLGNMLILWVFGTSVEDRLTRWWFLAFYLVGGAAAGAAHALLEISPALGASGAVAAVTGAYIVLFPRTNVKCILFLFIIGIFNIPAWIFILFAIAKDLVFAGIGGDNVAYFAHIGGYAYGILISLALLWRRVLAREPYDLFTIGRQAYRRRQLKEVTHNRDPARAVRRATTENHTDDSPAARARAAVATLLAQHKPDEAAAAYKRLVEDHAATPPLCTLSQRQQLDIANHFFAAADHEAAAYAYDRFLEAYPRDTETPRVRLLLGLINTRYLNDPVRARQLLNGLAPLLRNPDEKTLAETLVSEIG
jgi:membrane associated rhomboid family serine protease